MSADAPYPPREGDPGTATARGDRFTVTAWLCPNGGAGATIRELSRPQTGVTMHYPPARLAAWIAIQLTKRGAPWFVALEVVERTIDELHPRRAE